MSEGEVPAAARGAERGPMSVDAAALKALAHPLRVRMYDLLGDHGSATASQLADQVGESSGTTSYHLRLLAKHGFIEEDTERGNKRDRYWKVRGYNLDASSLLDDPDTAADFRVATSELWRTYARQIETWFRTAERWGSTWMTSSVSSMMRFDATPEELVALREEVMDVIGRHVEAIEGRETPEGSARVVAQFHLFPLGVPEQGPPGG